ncbi:MAG: hypothetical protein HDS45_01480 [Bacteroides sp.]|nr:hypothetical protein [Bacteroides sp.]MDE7463277.1 hypothetical protein [Muribaculaceae bacterium]
MKIKNYERPELEEIVLFIEGSFLVEGSGKDEGDFGGEVDPTPGTGDNWD